MTTLASSVRSVLFSAAEVIRLGPIRRSTSIFSQGQPADAIYILEDGLIKLSRTSESGSKVICSICGPGQLLGEEAMAEMPRQRYTAAETLTSAMVYRVPRETLRRLAASDPELSSAVITYLVDHGRDLVEKGELLCLYDVEYRVLYYLASLVQLVKPMMDGSGYPLPLTQLELANLIGATRETTSTTLNNLERRGLVKLSRRLMTVPSAASLTNAAKDRLSYTQGGS